MAPPSSLLRPLVVTAGVLLAMLLVVSRPVPTHAAETDPVGVWPLLPVPEVVTGFDPPDSPWGAGHRGVDLLGNMGQPVRSALSGRVTFAGVLAGRGVVVVDHGATRTTYEPVDASVALGDPVAAGDRIGRLALAGSHCLPRACLHWGWIEDETYLDPLRLVGAGPVRLLPLWRDDPVTGSATAPGLDTPVATSFLSRAARSTTNGGPAAASPPWRAPPLPYDIWQSPLRLLLSGGLPP